MKDEKLKQLILAITEQATIAFDSEYTQMNVCMQIENGIVTELYGAENAWLYRAIIESIVGNVWYNLRRASLERNGWNFI